MRCIGRHFFILRNILGKVIVFFRACYWLFLKRDVNVYFTINVFKILGSKILFMGSGVHGAGLPGERGGGLRRRRARSPLSRLFR